MANATTKALVTSAAQTKAVTTKAKDTQKNLITILEKDHNFNLVSRIVTHIGQIERAKKIKPIEKHRMIYNYHVLLMSYAFPKMKVVEDTGGPKQPMNFQITIGEPQKQTGKKQAGAGGVSITIPTKKQSDGSYSID